MMKKLLLYSFITLSLFSCSVNDDGENFYFEILPVENAVVPDEFLTGETYTIEYSYLRPSSCHAFNDLYYRVEGNTRTIAVVNHVLDDSNCQTLEDEVIEHSFQFVATQSSGSSYTFKFWQGDDNNGDAIYLIFEVPVN